jgi:hypothetical protein
MPFTKRALSGEECLQVRESLSDLEAKWVPSPTWHWAVDPARQAFFAQLISDHDDMREGVYRYVLLLPEGRVLISLTGRGSDVNPEAVLGRLPASNQYSIEMIKEIANEAMQVVDAKQSTFRFVEIRPQKSPPWWIALPAKPTPTFKSREFLIFIAASGIYVAIWMIGNFGPAALPIPGFLKSLAIYMPAALALFFLSIGGWKRNIQSDWLNTSVMTAAALMPLFVLLRRSHLG